MSRLAFTPRPYQVEATQAAVAAWQAGQQNVMVVLATGLGKTEVFIMVAQQVRALGWRKVLVLAHRDELISQARGKFEDRAPHEHIGTYKSSTREVHADIIVGSVQSCYPDRYSEKPCPDCRMFAEDDPTDESRWGRGHGCSTCNHQGIITTLERKGRINELPLDEIDLVVIDECHHITQKSIYNEVLKAIRAVNPRCKLLAVTATPVRADGKKFGWLFPGVTYHKGIFEGIAEGWLAPILDICQVDLTVDLSTIPVNKQNGDWRDKDLGLLLDNEGARLQIVEAWQTNAGPGAPGAGPLGRQTIVFCPTVDFAEHMADAFNAAGVVAEWVCGDKKRCSDDQRKARLSAFRAGKIRVLVNVGVLTEGFDHPAVSCVLIARPTKSDALRIQMVGRGTRIVGKDIHQSIINGKANCLVINCADASGFSLTTLADFGPEREKKMLRDGFDEEDTAEVLEADQLDFEIPDAVSTIKIEGHRVYHIDVMSGRVAWFPINGCRVSCTSVTDGVIVYADGEDIDGTTYGALAYTGGTLKQVAQWLPEREAMKAGERYTIRNGASHYMRPADFNRKITSTQITRMRKLLRAIAAHTKAGIRGREIQLTDISIQNLSMAEASAWLVYLEIRKEHGDARQR